MPCSKHRAQTLSVNASRRVMTRTVPGSTPAASPIERALANKRAVRQVIRAHRGPSLNFSVLAVGGDLNSHIFSRQVGEAGLTGHSESLRVSVVCTIPPPTKERRDDRTCQAGPHHAGRVRLLGLEDV